MSKTENRSTIRLPKCLHAIAEIDAAKSRRVTIIGANGAGKSRFMDEMIELNLNYLDEFNKDSEVKYTVEEARKTMKEYFPQLKR